MFTFLKSVLWSSPKKDGNGEIRGRLNHKEKMGSTSSSQCSDKNEQGDRGVAREHVVADSHDNGQVTTESKAPTIPPCSAAIDEPFDKPIDTVNVQPVIEAKALTNLPSSSTINELLEDPMDADNPQVVTESKAPTIPSCSLAINEPFDKSVDTVNVQPVTEAKVLTNLPCPSVIDKLLKKPADTANVQSVTGAKAPSNLPCSSVIHELSEGHMGADNRQEATESKKPTSPSRTRAVDEPLEEPIANVRSVSGAKALTTPPSSSTIHGLSEEPMDADNDEVVTESKAPIIPSCSPAIDEPFEKPVDTANVQSVVESKMPTNLPCPSVIGELLKEPVDTTNVQLVNGVKAPTTPPFSSVIDQPPEEPMDTDNGQVDDEDEVQIIQSHFPVVSELLEQTMEKVTSTSEDSIVVVDSDEDTEMMSNDGESRSAKPNAYVEWEMKERACLAQYLVRQKKILQWYKKKRAAGEVRKMPNDFWPMCAKHMKKMGYNKDARQCSNQRIIICAFTKDQMKIHFDFDDEEADLLSGLWCRKKKQTKTPKKGESKVTPRATRYKATWMPDEETEFVSYLVRDCKELLQKMSKGTRVKNFFVGCEEHFDVARSRGSYRYMAKKMRKYDDDTLKNEHKLTDDEIELLRKPWLGEKEE